MVNRLLDIASVNIEFLDWNFLLPSQCWTTFIKPLYSLVQPLGCQEELK